MTTTKTTAKRRKLSARPDKYGTLSAKFQVDVRPDMLEALNRMAKRGHMTRNAVVRALLLQGLRNNGMPL